MIDQYKPLAQKELMPKNKYRLQGSALRFDTTIDHERADANDPNLSVVADLNLGGGMPLELIDLRGLPVNDKGDKVMLDGSTINATGAFLLVSPSQLDAKDGKGFKLIREGESVTLGRGSLKDRFIMPDTVSGKHAEISYVDGVLTLTDLASTNATFANTRLNLAEDKSKAVEVDSFAGPEVVEGLGGGAVGLVAAEDAPAAEGGRSDGMIVPFGEWQQRRSVEQPEQDMQPEDSGDKPGQGKGLDKEQQGEPIVEKEARIAELMAALEAIEARLPESDGVPLWRYASALHPHEFDDARDRLSAQGKSYASRYRELSEELRRVRN